MNKDFTTQYLIKIALRVAGPILIFLCVVYIVSIISIHGLSEETITSTKDAFSTSGSLGDTINGIFAPLMGGLAVITTFLAFIAQYDANQKITKQFQRERFENKFYEMLRLHKENINEVEIRNNYKGRKAFIKMYVEFRFIYFIVNAIRENWEEKGKAVNDNEDYYMKIAYTIFFFGVGDLEEGSLIYESKDDKFFEEVIEYCNNKVHTEKKEAGHISARIPNKGTQIEIWDAKYNPMMGHASKLGHYFRHLYQTIKFVVLAPPFSDDLEEDQKIKYEYIKTLRAQLSNHEQAMIYFNSFFKAGNVWWGDDKIKSRNKDGSLISYFLNWRIIKNLPFNLTQFGVSPKDKFARELENRGNSKKEIENELVKLFEWLE
ncbi:putative phage abortive infection protein [Marivirga arenosa]|uniref:Phage abortive infection protein n=1 Tax=Marivirga arenosa TaxID=3059076 RepID=A0AA51ZVK9_9BACT|nr:putative phage abortive infection protein [Marivirga sp. BKB1-2]WNB17549.1 putative phage abortive infection protein [Marivirga sp. BKB1-2]